VRGKQLGTVVVDAGPLKPSLHAERADRFGRGLAVVEEQRRGDVLDDDLGIGLHGVDQALASPLALERDEQKRGQHLRRAMTITVPIVSLRRSDVLGEITTSPFRSTDRARRNRRELICKPARSADCWLTEKRTRFSSTNRRMIPPSSRTVRVRPR
jgi:hypothetical protein